MLEREAASLTILHTIKATQHGRGDQVHFSDNKTEYSVQSLFSFLGENSECRATKKTMKNMQKMSWASEHILNVVQLI